MPLLTVSSSPRRESAEDEREVEMEGGRDGGVREV